MRHFCVVCFVVVVVSVTVLALLVDVAVVVVETFHAALKMYT